MSIIESPVVVAVCGSPGAGKTTTARAVATRLGVPLLSRDEIADGLRLSGVPAAAIRERAEALLVTTATGLAAAGTSFVVDNSVLSGGLVDGLLGAGARLLAVHVVARDEVVGARLRERVAVGRPGETVVRDGDRRLLALFEQGAMRQSVFEPPAGPYPVVEIDTSDGTPGVEQIVEAAGSR
ncbi:hypothetical protein GCM10010168_35470 [Actinoplanes ianthinogenes]|uniref:AAA+ ATPase domain-containing protein n=1 Tax=Actinoplanes ianthinogenes TaxID=122358 RepID=A0ABM7M5K4_9ACTN|nr:AAA family ATPase [Actinoplanes ianthinogenes]BCJ46933.1 hypothetical protein Aiant_75900 [Actinoplanes ianthinogenes]GGR14538.1 hypothetical protein GCM10010168_35470 [Actinoplanes ianthinogenes]